MPGLDDTQFCGSCEAHQRARIEERTFRNHTTGKAATRRVTVCAVCGDWIGSDDEENAVYQALVREE